MTDSTARHRVTVIPGDGVGPEVTRAGALPALTVRE